MKMAEAVMKKKLQPGMTIPGCNSFFLCKYLKDTMLQARTYLFCAIRPEVSCGPAFASLRFSARTLSWPCASLPITSISHPTPPCPTPPRPR